MNYALTFKYKSHPNDFGFFSTPIHFDFYSDAVKFMSTTRDLTPWKHIQYCHIQSIRTNQIWDFPFFK